VTVGDKYGYIDKTGALVILATLDRAMTFSEGLAAAKLDKLYGGRMNLGRNVDRVSSSWSGSAPLAG